MIDLLNLHSKIETITPITGVSIGNPNDKSTWKVHYVNEPTDKDLEDVKAIIDSYEPLSVEEMELNAKSQTYLASTDWQVLRHLEQVAMKGATSMGDIKFQELLQSRQAARDRIIKDGESKKEVKL